MKTGESGSSIASRAALALALLVPAGIYLALAFARSPQYRYVVENATSRVWPLAFALAAVFAFLVISLLMITASRKLDRLTVIASFAHPLAFLASVFATGQRSAPAIIAAVLTVATLIALFNGARRPASADVKLAAPRRVRKLLGLACGIYLAFGIATAVNPIEAPRALGSLVILTVFSGALGVVLGFLALRPRIGSIAFCYVLIAAILFDQNNHDVPRVKSRVAPIDMGSVFGQWLSSRQDAAAYRDRNKPYPVILVSSEGGGIYAAAHAYGTLSAIQKNCPTFSQHVFATVGVSGGALGNLLFAGSVNPSQSNYQACRPVSTQMPADPVLADHLSPVLARLLLLEVVDRLVPGQWVPRDRAQVLSDSFLDVAVDKEYSRLALSDSFNPRGARPAVISVSTDVSTGKRVVMSPMYAAETGQTAEWWPTRDYETGEPSPSDGEEISQIDAAGLSARFPWVTPTGRLREPKGADMLLADGGYFENSGADTVFDLILALKASDRWEKFQDAQCSTAGSGCLDPNKLYLGGDEEDCGSPRAVLVENFHEDVKWSSCRTPVFVIHLALASREPTNSKLEANRAENPRPRQSFLADPLNTLLATRNARGEVALGHMDVELCGTKISGSECFGQPGSSLGMFRNDISPATWKLPLGWFMSRGAFDRIIAETAPRRWFDYQRHRQQYQSDTELLIYHLDPALYDSSADPSISDLIGGP